MDIVGDRLAVTAGQACIFVSLAVCTVPVIDALPVLRACSLQDKKLNVWNAATGKAMRQHRQDPSAGEPIKIQVDPSGAYFVTSSTDRTIRLYEFATGEGLAKGTRLLLRTYLSLTRLCSDGSRGSGDCA